MPMRLMAPMGLRYAVWGRQAQGAMGRPGEETIRLILLALYGSSQGGVMRPALLQILQNPGTIAGYSVEPGAPLASTSGPQRHLHIFRFGALSRVE